MFGFFGVVKARLHLVYNCRGDPQMASQQQANDRRLSQEVRLHGFLVARVEEMQAAIQQTAITDFNSWLV